MPIHCLQQKISGDPLNNKMIAIIPLKNYRNLLVPRLIRPCWWSRGGGVDLRFRWSHVAGRWSCPCACWICCWFQVTAFNDREKPRFFFTQLAGSDWGPCRTLALPFAGEAVRLQLRCWTPIVHPWWDTCSVLLLWSWDPRSFPWGWPVYYLGLQARYKPRFDAIWRGIITTSLHPDWSG